MSIISRLFNRKKQENIREMDQEFNDKIEAEEDQEQESGEGESSETEASDTEYEEDDIEYEVVEREILPAKIICPDCGGITLEGLDFCDKCGGELL